MVEVLRYAAFTLGGEGGNPAGVVLDASDLDEAEMQAIAAEVGYSETAFLRPRPDEPNVYDVRYFAPASEVPFCGHATIAAAVALAEREPAAEMIFHTPAGLVTLNTQESRAGVVAELTSVAPRVMDPPEGLVEACLETLHWAPEDLDPSYPPKLANAGAEHLILVVRTHERLLDLHYDFDALAAHHGRARLGHSPAGLAEVPQEVLRPQPVPQRGSGGGPGDRGRGRRVRRLPAGAGQDRAHGVVHDPAGGRDRPAQPDRGQRDGG